MKYTKEVSVGLSLVLAAVIFIFGVRYFEDLPLFHGTYELNTSFEDVKGITEGSPVRVSGVRVGAVDAIKLDTESARVLVRFHVEETVAVPEGSQTSLSGIAALGSMYMEVQLGPQGNERIREGGFVPSTQEGSLLESMTDRAPALADNLESVLTNANRTLVEAEVLFRDANPSVQQTLRAYRQSGEALEELIRSERQNISAAVVSLRDFSGDMSRFSDSSADSLSVAVQKLNRSMTSLEATLASLDASTKTLDGILMKIDEGDGTMARLINDPSVYQKLDSTLTLLNGLIEEVKNDPKKYLKHMSLIDIF